MYLKLQLDDGTVETFEVDRVKNYGWSSRFDDEHPLVKNYVTDHPGEAWQYQADRACVALAAAHGTNGTHMIGYSYDAEVIEPHYLHLFVQYRDREPEMLALNVRAGWVMSEQGATVDSLLAI